MESNRTPDRHVFELGPEAACDLTESSKARGRTCASTAQIKIIVDDTPTGASSLSSAPERDEFRQWLLKVLEEHRVQTCEELKKHADVLRLCLEPDDDVFPVNSPASRVSRSRHLWSPATSETIASAKFSIKPSNGIKFRAMNTKPSLQTVKSKVSELVSQAMQEDVLTLRRSESIFTRVRKAASCDGVGIRPHPTWYALMRYFMCQGTATAVSPTSLERASSMSSDAAAEKLMASRHNASSLLDYVVGFLILGNSAVMIVQLEYYGYLNRIALGDVQDDGSWAGADTCFDVSEHIFNALFVLELAARLLMHGPHFFTQKSLIFDAVLVLISSVQLYYLETMDNSGGDHVLLFRLLRFTRFVRVLRLVRVLKLFPSLRVLVKTVFSSFGALMWSMVLLMLIIANAGLVMSVLLREFIMDDAADLATRRWVFNYYGTATRAIYTLFEVTMAGCWPQYFRPLIERVSVWWFLFIVTYISVVVFAIIRIITALFLKETLHIANEDAEMMVAERMKHKDSYIRKLEKVFKAVDVAGTGRLSQEEFACIMSNQVVKTWLHVLELEVHDAESLFRLLDDGDGELTYDEFMKGLMRLKGQARTMDMVGLMHTVDKMSKSLVDVQDQMEKIQVTISGRLSGRGRSMT